MSGIAGLIATDGRDADRHLLEQMATCLAYRGSDDQGVHTEGCVGFAHTLLVTDSREHATQPYTLDGESWIVADVRLDARGELVRKLAANDRIDSEAASDAELILRSYRQWDVECLHYLLGDFAFAIWDGGERRLFCARDHFGVKPFFYADSGAILFYSNTLDCLRKCPGVTDALEDQAIAEFLLFGHLRTPSLSAFRDIRRLPAGHRLTWSYRNGMAVDRYWELPVPEPIRYRSAEEYPARFNELMEEAVKDRVHDGSTCVIMSGGLDSTTVAVYAREFLPSSPGRDELKACTFVYEHLIEDDEGLYARDVAEALGIPTIMVSADREELSWQEGSRITPEPTSELGIDHGVREALRLFEGYRVGLTGHGGDLALHPTPSHAGRFFRELFFGGLGFEILRYRLRHGRLPRMGLRKSFRKWLRSERPGLRSAPPPWLDADLNRLLDLPAQWHKYTEGLEPPAGTLRSTAHSLLRDPIWASMFEGFDPGSTGITAELRHPWFDLRLISFLLALPPLPWCVDKKIVRSTMNNRLPRSVLERPKTPLRGFTGYEIIKSTSVPQLEDLCRVEGLDHFVDVRRYGIIAAQPQKLRPEEYDLITRPLGLARWLSQPSPEQFKPSQEK